MKATAPTNAATEAATSTQIGMAATYSAAMSARTITAKAAPHTLEIARLTAMNRGVAQNCSATCSRAYWIVNGRPIASREDFYHTLWQGGLDQDVQVTVERLGGRHAITVRPVDRYRFYRAPDK